MQAYLPEGTRIEADVDRSQLVITAYPPGQSWPVTKDTTGYPYLEDLPACIAWLRSNFAKGNAVKIVMALRDGIPAYGRLMQLIKLPDIAMP
jgi:hypothetical protein